MSRIRKTLSILYNDFADKMSQINFVYVYFLHCGDKKDPRLREDDNGGVGDDDGKAGMAKLVESTCLRRAQWRVSSCPGNPTCRYPASGCFRR